MRGTPDDRDGTAPSTPLWRTVGLGAGAVLAVAATVVVFLTDDPQVLRLAVVGGAWAFVLALLATGRRPAAPDTADLRRAAELELAREVAGRREYELETENRLRRESDDATRAEVAALRRDVAALAGLRQDLAALGSLRQDVAGLGALRAEVAALSGLRQELAALAGLRSDVAALGALREDVAGPGGLREEVARLAATRTDLGQLADLRAELGRLRTELTDQLSSEMFLERVVMRTQSSRGPVGTVTTAGTVTAGTVDAPATRSIQAVSWSDEAPRELAAGWPAVRLGNPAHPIAAHEVPAHDIPAHDIPAHESPAPEPSVPMPQPAPATRGYDAMGGIRPHRTAAAASSQGLGASLRAVGGEEVLRPALPGAEEAPRRRRRTDPGAAEQLTVERPQTARGERSAPAPLPPEPLPAPPLTVQAPAVPTPGEARLAQILAESGAGERTSGRRRHRYRDEDEDDDVLARVLRRP